MQDKLMEQIEARARHFGPMRDANGYASLRGECGDLAEVWLRIDGGRIRKSSFMTDGCGWSTRCANSAVTLIEGWETKKAYELKSEHVLNAAGEVPADHHHCADLAARTIRLAITNHLNPPQKKQSLLNRLKQFLKRT